MYYEVTREGSREAAENNSKKATQTLGGFLLDEMILLCKHEPRVHSADQKETGTILLLSWNSGWISTTI